MKIVLALLIVAGICRLLLIFNVGIPGFERASLRWCEHVELVPASFAVLALIEYPKAKTRNQRSIMILTVVFAALICGARILRLKAGVVVLNWVGVIPFLCFMIVVKRIREKERDPSSAY
ncbi:MAG: hypothetical protein ABSD31_14995 [Candidatus Binataceae bacterium]